MIERNKTNVALDGLFEQFLNLISEARRVPLVDKIMVDENDLLNIIDDLKEAIPREIKSANQVLEEQKNIVNKAYADADRIVQQAKDEAERIVSVAQAEADAKVQQEEIVKQANAAAEDIKANALRYQEETKLVADEYALQVKQSSLKYADDMLEFLSGNLTSALGGLKENIQSVKEEMNNIQHPQAPAEAPEPEAAVRSIRIIGRLARSENPCRECWPAVPHPECMMPPRKNILRACRRFCHILMTSGATARTRLQSTGIRHWPH